MNNNTYPTNLEDFIDNVLEPSESFARLCQNAYIGVCLNNGKTHIKADFEDIAQISGALTSLVRHRLTEFAHRLKEQAGHVEVVQPCRDVAVAYEVEGVSLGEVGGVTAKKQ